MRKSKPEIAYDHLRTAILSGRLRPRERVVVSQVAAQLGISEIPVREAVKRLEAEALVRLVPNSGAVVADLTLEQVQELFAMRSVLEGLAARSACSRVSPAALEQMDRLMSQMQASQEQGRFPEFSRLNRDFHWAIYGASPYAYLQKSIADLMHRTEWCMALFAILPEKVEQQMQEHRLMLACIRSGREEELEAVMRRHTDETRRTLEDLVRRGVPLVWPHPVSDG